MSIAISWGKKMNLNFCAYITGFCKASHIYATSTTTCPVRATCNYNDMLTKKQSQNLVFSAVTISPLFHPRLTTILRQLLSWAGLCQSHYALHSFIITTATAIGLTPSLIKTLGRWNSDAYMVYVHCPQSVITTIPQ